MRELLGFAVARPREGVNLASLMVRHLRDDVSRSAESVNAQPFCIAGFDQRAIANQTGAEQRRSAGVGIKLRQRETETLVRQHEFRVAPVQRIAGEAGLLTKVLATGTAKAAVATRPAQPRNTDARADFKPFRSFAALDDFTDDFVARDKREFRLSQLAIDDMQVGPTDGAGANADQDLADARFGRWQIRFAERLPGSGEHHCAH